MRTWGDSGAGAAIRRAQKASEHARRTGCPIDEAVEIVEERSVTRRRFLAGAGAAAAATMLPNALASPAGASVRRESRRSGHGAKPSVVIVGSGIAGLGCAYSLWRQHGIQADVYEYNTVPGGRIRTLRGYFAQGQEVEEHAEFINPEHTKTLALAKSFGLTLDNSDAYPPGSHPHAETMLFHGRMWPQAALSKDWHDWGWKLFHKAAFTTAPWPVLYNAYSPGALTFDQMSVPQWINAYVPGGVASDFGALCISAVLDEFGGDPDEQSSLNLVYLLGQDDSRGNSFQPRGTPALGGANEKWHIHGGTDLLISGLLDRLPAGILNLGQKLVALRPAGSGGYVCSFESGGTTQDVTADHVVLSLPFTTLRSVDLSGVSDIISPLHMEAIKHEPLGYQLQVLRPVHLPGVEHRARHRQRLLRRGRPRGVGAHRLPGWHGRHPGRPSRWPDRDRLGDEIRLDQLLGSTPGLHGDGLSGRVRETLPRHHGGL